MMPAGKEQREYPRHKISLELRVVTMAGKAVDIIGETHDIGAGGVSFVLPSALPVGETIDYEISFSGNGPAARGRCGGVILRCRGVGDAWMIAATMERYLSVKTGEMESTRAASFAPPSLIRIPPVQTPL
jgi:hypothetical protein